MSIRVLNTAVIWSIKRVEPSDELLTPLVWLSGPLEKFFFTACRLRGLPLLSKNGLSSSLLHSDSELEP